MTKHDAVLAALRAYGRDALSFAALEPGMKHWFAGSGSGSGSGVGAVVAYVDTGSAWVAAGAPLAPAPDLARIARAFVAAAREHGRRACFFATEAEALAGFDRVLVGEQPAWDPTGWQGTLRAHRRLREQIRRASAKGVRVRRVESVELRAGTPLRARCDALAASWLAARQMAPMTFIVALEPFCFAEEHRYFLAERDGEVVAFLSAVPIYAKEGWLVEDLPRDRRAPNGTAELLVDALMRDVGDSAFVTLGLAPLAGPVSVWLRVARWAGRPLYDFRGLRAFKQRLRPREWQPVWLVFPSAERAVVHVVDALRAFAGGSLVAFGLRTLVRHPSAPPLALALPLVPWTALLALLVVAGRADLLGFSTAALAAWVVFDALLVVQLLRSAARPRPARLVASALPAVADAALSLRHLALDGLGDTAMTATLRLVATLAPCAGAAILTWTTHQAIRRARS